MLTVLEGASLRQMGSAKSHALIQTTGVSDVWDVLRGGHRRGKTGTGHWIVGRMSSVQSLGRRLRPAARIAIMYSPVARGGDAAVPCCVPPLAACRAAPGTLSLPVVFETHA